MIPVSLIDYTKCHEYARSQCGQFGIPLCDAEDIGSDAFLLSIRRSWRTGGVENDIADTNPEALAKRLMYTAVIDVIRRRNTHSQTVYLDSSPVVEPDENDDNPDDEPLPSGIVLGDNGKGAETTRTFDENWEDPFWLRLFDSERQKLRRERTRSALAAAALSVIRALLRDSRMALARANCRLSGRTFANALCLLRERFALAYEALRRATRRNSSAFS